MELTPPKCLDLLERCQGASFSMSPTIPSQPSLGPKDENHPLTNLAELCDALCQKGKMCWVTR